MADDAHRQGVLDLGRSPDAVVAGVDEAGRGPLAGPVVAAAVVLAADHAPAGIDDSKKLTAATRERLCVEIKRAALAWHVAVVDAETVDDINILQATMLAMHDAVAGIGLELAHIRVDGNRAPRFSSRHRHARVETLVGGDAIDRSIAAASIIAKTTRDALMLAYDARWPQFGFARHKGYGTAAHLAALREHGPCDIHRRSFAPVRKLLAASAG